MSEPVIKRSWRFRLSLIEKLEEYFAKNPAKTKDKCVSELLEFALDNFPTESIKVSPEAQKIITKYQKLLHKDGVSDYTPSEILQACLIVKTLQEKLA